MDTQTVESVLAEVGKAFRLCRFYPPTHPSVQQVMADSGRVAADAGADRAGRARIGPAGFALGTTPPCRHIRRCRSSPTALRAGPSHAGAPAGRHGRRSRGADPCDGGDVGRSGPDARRRRSAAAAAHPLWDGPQVHPRPPRGGAGRRGGGGDRHLGRPTGVFRPNALPPEIEARRAHRAAGRRAGRVPARARWPGSRAVAMRSWPRSVTSAPSPKRWRRSPGLGRSRRTRGPADAGGRPWRRGTHGRTAVGLVADPPRGAAAQQRDRALAAVGALARAGGRQRCSTRTSRPPTTTCARRAPDDRAAGAPRRAAAGRAAWTSSPEPVRRIADAAGRDRRAAARCPCCCPLAPRRRGGRAARSRPLGRAGGRRAGGR